MWVRLIARDHTMRLNLRSDATIRDLFEKVNAADATRRVLYFIGARPVLLRNTQQFADTRVREHMHDDATLFLRTKACTECIAKERAPTVHEPRQTVTEPRRADAVVRQRLVGPELAEGLPVSTLTAAGYDYDDVCAALAAADGRAGVAEALLAAAQAELFQQVE